MELFRSKSNIESLVLVGLDLDELAIAHEQNNTSALLFCIIYQPNIKKPVLKVLNKRRTILVDLLDKKAVADAFKLIQKVTVKLDLVIFKPPKPVTCKLEQVSSTQIQELWQLSGLTAINVAQNAIRSMLKHSHGTFIFLNMPHQLQSTTNFSAQYILSAGIRALSQSLAREFQPKGLHIVNFEQTVLEYELKSAAAVLLICKHLHEQPKSTWTQELTA